MTDDTRKTTAHHSKVAVLVDVERALVTITLDCDVCGRVALPPIAIEHVPTLAAVATKTAKNLELQPGTLHADGYDDIVAEADEIDEKGRAYVEAYLTQDKRRH